MAVSGPERDGARGSPGCRAASASVMVVWLSLSLRGVQKGLSGWGQLLGELAGVTALGASAALGAGAAALGAGAAALGAGAAGLDLGAGTAGLGLGAGAAGLDLGAAATI